MGKEQMIIYHDEGTYRSDPIQNIYNWLHSNSGDKTSTKSINYLYFSQQLAIL